MGVCEHENESVGVCGENEHGVCGNGIVKAFGGSVCDTFCGVVCAHECVGNLDGGGEGGEFFDIHHEVCADASLKQHTRFL